MERLHQRGPDQLVYHCPKPQSGGKHGDLHLKPLELIDKTAALVPPPRSHLHRYYGVFAPNSPLRCAVTALATQHGESDHAESDKTTAPKPPTTTTTTTTVEQASASRSPARYPWALLIARIYEVFPLRCPQCCGPMRIIAFINDGAEIRKILEYIGVDPQPPKITPARGPPLGDGWDGNVDEHIADPDAWDDMDQRRPDADRNLINAWPGDATIVAYRGVFFLG